MSLKHRVAEISLKSNAPTEQFKTWGARTHKRYYSLMQGLSRKDPELKARAEPEKCVFLATTFNVGERVATVPHFDSQNFGPGGCAITALGDFDPITEGHLVLWELNIVIEFPPGATTFIPSAVLIHSNTAVREGHTRMSITQYTSGGLFRWAEGGYRSVSEFEGEQTPEEAEKYKDSLKAQVARAMDMYMTKAEVEATKRDRV